MQNIILLVIGLGVLCLQGVFGIALTEADIRPSHRECLNELNLETELLLTSFDDDWVITTGNKDLNNIALCTFRKEHLVKDDDTLDLDKYQDALVNEFFAKVKLNLDNPNETALNAIDACRSIQGSDAGDTLVKHHNCIINYLKSLRNTVEV